MKQFFRDIGEFVFWLLWPDTYACVLFQRCFRACPSEQREAAFQALSACDNVRSLEETVTLLEDYWMRLR